MSKNAHSNSEQVQPAFPCQALPKAALASVSLRGAMLAQDARGAEGHAGRSADARPCVRVTVLNVTATHLGLGSEARGKRHPPGAQRGPQQGPRCKGGFLEEPPGSPPSRGANASWGDFGSPLWPL